MPRCGSQVYLCDVPIRFDTYKGCSHGCKYCFVTRKADITHIGPGESVGALKNFIEGRRNAETTWAPLGFPLHWGGTSDPFQPAEARYRYSMDCLKVFAASKYPVIISTKGALICTPEYLDMLRQCNVVVQVSAVCSQYDRLEPGAPPFEERLEMIRALSGAVQRVVVRIQPYMLEVLGNVLRNIPRFAEAGAYGVILEGMKYAGKRPGMIQHQGDFVFPKKRLEEDFKKIRQEAHAAGMKFFSGENRLRGMGDDLCCCGVGDLFPVNRANLNHFLWDRENYQFSEAMKRQGTADCFKSLCQNTAGAHHFKSQSFESMMDFCARDKKVLSTFLAD